MIDSIIQWEKETGITMEQKVERFNSNNNNNNSRNSSNNRYNNEDNNNNTNNNTSNRSRNFSNSSNRNRSEIVTNYYVNICTENLILFNKRVELSYGDAMDQ